MSEKMIPSRRMLVTLLGEICAEADIDLMPLSDHWVLRLEKAGLVRHVYGYNFESNTATAQLISNDKFAAYSVLKHADVPVIEHNMFQRPLTPQSELNQESLITQAGIPPEVWQDILAYFTAHAQNIVCKMNPGSGGYHVHRARSLSELEHVIARLFRESRAICLSPFVEIRHEYRVFVHQNQPLLIYRKDRPYVLGDGQHTVQELMGEKYPEIPPMDDQRVLRTDERIELNWKHNLGQGSRASIVEAEDLKTLLEPVAIQAAQALGISFASIDIIETASGYAVLEVNSGIMMESFARQGAHEYGLAKDIYRRAVYAMMGIELQGEASGGVPKLS